MTDAPSAPSPPVVDRSDPDVVVADVTISDTDAFLVEPREGGRGAATLGSPLVAVAWLANTLGSYGRSLSAGEVILSGSLVPLEPVQAGDQMRATIEGIGEVAVRFT